MLFQLTNPNIVSLLSQSAAKQTRLCDHASCVPVMMMNGDYKSLALDSSKPGGRFEGRSEEVSSITSAFYIEHQTSNTSSYILSTIEILENSTGTTSDS